MRNLIDIFHVMSKYHTHEGVYFTGPSPEELTAEDLATILALDVTWLPEEKMWKRTIDLHDIVVSHLEDTAANVKEEFTGLKLDLRNT